MSFAGMLTTTVRILAFDTNGTDPYGNPAPGWADPTAVTPTPARLNQASADELVTDRDTQITTWKLHLPAGTPIGGRDRVLTDEGLMDVHGEPARRRTPRGEHHVIAILRRAVD